MIDLGTCFDDLSKNSNLAQIFLANGCVLTGKQRLDELEEASGVEVVLMSLQEVIRALEDGEIKSMFWLPRLIRRSAQSAQNGP